MSHLRIAAIGKTGVGKSSFGNTVLNKKAFKSSSRGTSVTRICQSDDAMVNKRTVSLVDSPGFNDTHTENQDDIMKEIKRCMLLSAPGPHAICFVVQIGRCTMEDIGTIKAFVTHFGEALYDYVIVVFTRYDDYQRDCEEDGVECNIQNYVSTLPTAIKEFVEAKFGSRVIGFDNTLKGEESETQIIQLLQMIDDMLKKNENRYYSNKDLKKAAEIIESDMKKEKLRIEQEIMVELEKRQNEIDQEADKKVALMMKEEILAFKEEMKEKLEEENLRRNSQKSSFTFETFKNCVSIATCAVPIVAQVTKFVVQKVIQSKNTKSQKSENDDGNNDENDDGDASLTSTADDDDTVVDEENTADDDDNPVDGHNNTADDQENTADDQENTADDEKNTPDD